jgi:ABC-type lipoprotein release transport system permease subunit
MVQTPDVAAGLWNSGLAWGLVGVLLGLVVGLVIGIGVGRRRNMAQLRAYRMVEKLPVPPLTVRASHQREERLAAVPLHPQATMACVAGGAYPEAEDSAGE